MMYLVLLNFFISHINHPLYCHSTTNNISFTMAAIEPLTYDNYNTWKNSMRMVLIDADLWYFATNSPPNQSTTPKSTVAEYNTKTMKALAKIYLNCSKEVQPYLYDRNSGYEAWTHLQELFGKKNPQVDADLDLLPFITRLLEVREDYGAAAKKLIEYLEKTPKRKLYEKELIKVQRIYEASPGENNEVSVDRHRFDMILKVLFDKQKDLGFR